MSGTACVRLLLALAAAPALVRAASPVRAEELALRIVLPFDAREVAALQQAWNARAAEWGAQARFTRLLEPTRSDLAGDSLLVGFEEGRVEGLVAQGLLAGPPVPFARESWAPAWSVADRADVAACTSYRSLSDGAFSGRLRLRRPTADSTEGLLLGVVAATLRMDDDEWLRTLVLASDDAGTLLPAGRSYRELLRALPAGGLLLAPVRAAAAVQREGAPLEWGRPEEGFVSFTLAAAPSREASEPVRAWFARRFLADVAPQLRAAIELEPLGEVTAEAPAWQQRVAAAPLPFDRAAAEALRRRIVPLYGAAEAAVGGSAVDVAELLIDGALLTAALLFVLAVARRMGGRNDRDPRDGAVV